MNDNAILRSEKPNCQTSRGLTETLPLQVDRSAGNEQSASENRERHLLTDREGTIILLIGSGQSNKEIARELGIAPETIKSHLKRIFQKLSASTRTQAVVRAQNFGLVNLARSDDALVRQARQLELETLPR